MQELVKLTGMVLKTVPIGDYDRRVVILTKEKGKVAAFARGARKPNSRLIAAAAPFSFGEFKVYEGRTSATIVEADIQNYFEEMRTDVHAACYGMYFLEMMDYYTRENNDEKEMLKLLYQSLRALQRVSLSNELIRYIFEIKALVLNGEYPGIPGQSPELAKEYGSFEESTVYAVEYIAYSRVEKLYTFTVTDSVLRELGRIAAIYRKKYVDKEFKSLKILEDLS